MHGIMSNKTDVMIECDDLVKIYKTRDTEVMALRGLDIIVDHGEFVVIIGASGSGKSTLLNMLGGLDKPTMGKLTVNGHDMLKMSPSAMDVYKRETTGFIWQNNARNLVPYLTARENVELIGKMSGKSNKSYAAELLEMVGLTKRKNNKLTEMSSGEQQRVATAIALINKPKLLLADEPTSAVDTKTTALMMDMFVNLQKQLDLTIVIVSHDPDVAKNVDRVISIRDGKTSSEFLKTTNIAELRNFTEDTEEQIELAVVDRSGRLQIPEEYLKRLSIEKREKVRVEIEDEKIVIFPVDV